MIRLDLDLIRHALKTASDRGFASVEIGLGEDKFEAKLLPRKAAAQPLDGPAASEGVEFKTIGASAVGYYRNAAKNLQVGNQILAGEIVAEIVALGLTNEVVSKWSGTVVEVLVEADQPVEYGQAIARLDVTNE